MVPKAVVGLQGFCVYLLDASVPGWDTKLDGSGIFGALGKTGAVLAIGFDILGKFAGKPDHLAVKSAQDGKTIGAAVEVAEGIVTAEDDWRQVEIVCDLSEHTCTVSINQEEIVQWYLDGITIPHKVCAAVSGANTSSVIGGICVNQLDVMEYHKEED